MIGAIVLAAGSSTRMGRIKAHLPAGPNGRSFVDTIAATLASAGVAPVTIVVNHGLPDPPQDAVVNPNPSAGMLFSLKCGLRSFRESLDAVLVWPVDHPLVKRDTVVAMIAAAKETGAPVVVPTHGGKRGHPVLFAARVFPELLAADPSLGARSVVHAHDDRLELDVEDDGVVFDIDTPEDYERAFGVAAP
jgi:CTP:molybdopterin cytidylyltransferase MocA